MWEKHPWGTGRGMWASPVASRREYSLNPPTTFCRLLQATWVPEPPITATPWLPARRYGKLRLHPGSLTSCPFKWVDWCNERWFPRRAPQSDLGRQKSLNESYPTSARASVSERVTARGPFPLSPPQCCASRTTHHIHRECTAQYPPPHRIHDRRPP